MRKVNLIFSMDENGGIGKNNSLLIENKEDMEFFKEMTKHSIVVMGHNTFKSIGKPLPNRFNIVITSNDINCGDYSNLITITSIDGANTIIESAGKCMSVYGTVPNVYIIGGASIYNQYLENYRDMIDKVYVTQFVGTNNDADTFIDKQHIKNNFYKSTKTVLQTLSDGSVIYRYE